MAKNRLPPENQLPPEPADEGEGQLDLSHCLRSDDGPESPPEPLPPIVTGPPDPPRASYCWVCSQMICSIGEGLNLVDESDTRSFHLCHRCFDKLPNFEKIKVRLMVRQQSIGADLTRVVIETRNAILAFHSLIDLAMQSYKPVDPEDVGEGRN